MSVSLLTITGDRPLAFRLLEKYVSRQQLPKGYQWIVVDDGEIPTECTLNQDYKRLPHGKVQVESYCENLTQALECATTEFVIILEDDDYYGPDYVNYMQHLLSQSELVGLTDYYLYNVRYRRHRFWNERNFACMSHTAFRKPVIQKLLELLKRRRTEYLDTIIWKENLAKVIRSVELVSPAMTVGIKGMPGKNGVSFGHRPALAHFDFDHEGALLRRLIGGDAEEYMSLFEPTRPFFAPWP